MIIAHFGSTLIKRRKLLDESWRFAIAALVMARMFYALWSWVIFTIQPLAIDNFQLSGEPIVSIFRLNDSSAYVYLREVKGQMLTFQPANAQNKIDRQTGSIWSISNGAAISGKFKGSTLQTSNTKASDIFPYHGQIPYPGKWLAMWQRFDANWYLSIANRGYGNIPGDVHFPPLFPLLIHALQPVTRSPFLAGLLIGHAATFLVLKMLYDLFLQWDTQGVVKRALLLFVVFPTFFFCFSAYTEPIFLLAALFALRAMSRHAWLWAGFGVFCAFLIRLQGVALLAPMLYLMWRDPPFLRKLEHWTGFAIPGIAGLLYMYLRVGQGVESTLPFVETDLHARLVAPWQSYWYSVQMIFSGQGTYIDILNWIMTTLFVILLIWGWKKIPLAYNMYTAFSLFVLLTRTVEGQPLMSMSRYSLTLFPSFYVLALAGENPWLRRAIIYMSLLLNLYLSGQFFLWGWVA